MFFRLRRYFVINRQFAKILKSAIKLDGQRIKAIHISHWFGFVVNINRYIESRWNSKELSTIFYFKDTNIEAHLNSSKTQEYWIEWKKF